MENVSQKQQKDLLVPQQHPSSAQHYEGGVSLWKFNLMATDESGLAIGQSHAITEGDTDRLIQSPHLCFRVCVCECVCAVFKLTPWYLTNLKRLLAASKAR